MVAMSSHEVRVKTLLKLIERGITVLLGLVVAMVLVDVLLRNFLGGSLFFTDEFARYSMIWVAMMGAALLVAEDGHIRVSVLPASAPAKLRFVMGMVSQILVLFFLGVLFYASLIVLPDVSRDRTVTLGISMAVVYAALPVSAALMFILTLLNMALAIRTRNSSSGVSQ